MKELADLIRAWRALPPGSPAVLATVVATQGSTYRRAGARMLLTSGERLAGTISGGCLESDLVTTAWTRTERGPALATFDSTGEDDLLFGTGLGCAGITTVLLQRIPENGGPLALLDRLLESEAGGTLETVVSEGACLGAARIGEAGCDRTEGVDRDGLTILRERIRPPAPLLIFGAGDDAMPLARLALGLGWPVTVTDARRDRATPERFPEAAVLHAPADRPLRVPPGAAAVVMTHSYANDRKILAWLLRSPAAFIGQLGPRARTERLLGAIGATPEERARLHAPVGLDLGAEGPDEIALAIVAQILAHRRGRGGGFL